MGGRYGVDGRARARRTTRDAVAQLIGTTDLLVHATGLRPQHDLRLPDFLGIGAQKAGSTWLHENLRRHPQLYLPPQKELHFFDWFRERSLRSYAAHFADARHRLAGEITPAYSALSAGRVRLVRRLLPEARVILVLRDPVERAWSQFTMDLARKQGRPASSVTADEVALRLDQRGARRRSDLVRAVRLWGDAYGDQLWIGCYEHLRSRPEALLREIFVHLGVDPEMDVDDWPLRERFNPGGGAEPPDDVRELLEARLGGQRALLRDHCPDL
jgi:hypothetical protein